MRFPDTHDLLQISAVCNTLGAIFSSTEFFCFQKTIFFIGRTNLFMTWHNTTHTVMLILWMVLIRRVGKKSEREMESQIVPKYTASAPIFHSATDHFLSFTLLKASWRQRKEVNFPNDYKFWKAKKKKKKKWFSTMSFKELFLQILRTASINPLQISDRDLQLLSADEDGWEPSYLQSSCPQSDALKTEVTNTCIH